MEYSYFQDWFDLGIRIRGIERDKQAKNGRTDERIDGKIALDTSIK